MRYRRQNIPIPKDTHGKRYKYQIYNYGGCDERNLTFATRNTDCLELVGRCLKNRKHNGNIFLQQMCYVQYGTSGTVQAIAETGKLDENIICQHNVFETSHWQIIILPEIPYVFS